MYSAGERFLVADSTTADGRKKQKNNDGFSYFLEEKLILAVNMKQQTYLDNVIRFQTKPDTLRGQIAASKVTSMLEKQKFVNRHKKF